MTIHVGQFRHALPRIDFCFASSSVLVQQAHDQSPLKQDDGSNGGYLPPIFLPLSRLTEVNLAARLQASFTDPPTLHRSPVKSGRCKLDWRCFDIVRFLTAKHA